MNKITIWLMLAFITIVNCDVIAQPRVNPVSNNYKQLAESGVIETPVGWCLDNIDGKWCGYYGVISNAYKNNSSKPITMSAYDRAFHSDNISSMQFKKFESNDSIYYALYLVKFKGYYDYPAIYKGWHYYKNLEIYLFTSEEYNKLKNLKEGINTIYSFATAGTDLGYRYGTAQGKQHIDLRLQNIFNDLVNDEKFKERLKDYRFKNKFYVKLEDDNTIRFNIPTISQTWEEAEEINKANEGKRGYIPIRDYDCVNFSKEYFEVTKAQFDKLLIK